MKPLTLSERGRLGGNAPHKQRLSNEELLQDIKRILAEINYLYWEHKA